VFDFTFGGMGFREDSFVVCSQHEHRYACIGRSCDAAHPWSDLGLALYRGFGSSAIPVVNRHQANQRVICAPGLPCDA